MAESHICGRVALRCLNSNTTNLRFSSFALISSFFLAVFRPCASPLRRHTDANLRKPTEAFSWFHRDFNPSRTRPQICCSTFTTRKRVRESCQSNLHHRVCVSLRQTGVLSRSIPVCRLLEVHIFFFIIPSSFLAVVFLSEKSAFFFLEAI